jgi:RNA polymerase sigma-70 factor (ECF subfamily)
LPDNEKQLIQNIINGDKDAFKELIILYQKFVINICFKFVNNIDDANDIAQDVFIEVFKTIDKFRSDSKISTWLYRISVNRSLNFLRDNKKYKSTGSYSDEPEKIADYSSRSDSPDLAYANKERKELLDNAIDSLPDRQKAVFILNKKDGLSYDEISKVLGISLKAVESLLIRAKKNLQKKLIKYYK